MIHAVRQSHDFQRFYCQPVSLLFGYSAVYQRKLHIFLRRQIADQIKTLKNKTYLPVPDVRLLVVCQRGHILAIQVILSGCGNIQTAQHIHQRGFSGARLTDDRHELTFFYGKTYMVQCPDFIFSGIIDLADVLHLHQCAHSIFRFLPSADIRLLSLLICRIFISKMCYCINHIIQ